MPTGHAARRAEEAAHRRLCRAHPEAVMPRAEFGDAINVTREIYRPALLPRLEAEMDRIEQERDIGGSDAFGTALTSPATIPPTGDLSGSGCRRRNGSPCPFREASPAGEEME